MLSQETSHLRSVNELLPEEQYTFRFQALLLTSSAISRVATFAHTLVICGMHSTETRGRHYFHFRTIHVLSILLSYHYSVNHNRNFAQGYRYYLTEP